MNAVERLSKHRITCLACIASPYELCATGRLLEQEAKEQCQEAARKGKR